MAALGLPLGCRGREMGPTVACPETLSTASQSPKGQK